MGSTCNYLPPSPLQNSKDFEETAECSPCLGQTQNSHPSPTHSCIQAPTQPEGPTRAGQIEKDKWTHPHKQETAPVTVSTARLVTWQWERKASWVTVFTHMQNQESGLPNPVQEILLSKTANLLHIRMNSHRSDINTRKTDKPVAAHFNLPDHSLDDLQVIGIEKIHTNDAEWKSTEKATGFHPRHQGTNKNERWWPIMHSHYAALDIPFWHRVEHNTDATLVYKTLRGPTLVKQLVSNAVLSCVVEIVQV